MPFIIVTCQRLGDWPTQRDRLFLDDRDRRRFIDRLAHQVEQCDMRLYQFCLMANHFHLVLETPTANLSAFMQSISTAYTVYFNRRHRRHGCLLDGRFKSKLVSGDEYLLALSRYVHLNPVQTAALKSKSWFRVVEAADSRLIALMWKWD